MWQASDWIIGITGASGVRYALRLIEILAAQSIPTHVVLSEAALRVINEEEGRKLSMSAVRRGALFEKPLSQVSYYDPKDIGAAIASGSFPTAGMVVVPCSMASLGHIAHGTGQHLVHRAADVVLKEGRPLVMVPRETPLNEIHIENMLKLSRMGAKIVPAMPGFYHQPAGIDDIVDMMVMKILDVMGIRVDLVERWPHKRVHSEDEAETSSHVGDGGLFDA